MAEDEDEDEDEDSDEDIEEELGYISPLDNIDPYISFKEALTGAFDLHPPVF
jgi:importin-7